MSMLLFVALCFATSASAQGGWRQWNIYLVDGTHLFATPLGINDKGRFTHYMGDKEGTERSKIAYMAIVADDLPPVPNEKVKQDLIVLRDGAKSFGAITFKELKFSEGTLIQNGKEISTQKIAFIKFVPPKKRKY
jgi:hypothetical protein